MQIDIGPVTPLSVPAAAYAAGIASRTMRDYVAAVPLLVPRRAAGKWLRVAPVDALRLALVVHIVRGGFTIAEASVIVAEHIDRRFLQGVVMAAGDIPWFLLRNRLLGVTLAISRGPLGIHVTCDSLMSPRHPRPAATRLDINVDQILDEIYRRARSRGDAE